MRRKPRKKDGSILTKGEVVRLVLEGTVLSALSMGAYAFSLGSGEMHARGLALAVMVCGQVFLMGSKLSKGRANILRMAANKYLAPSAIAALLLYAAIMYVPFISAEFGIAPLGAWEWAAAVSLALAAFAASELAKPRATDGGQ